MSQPVKSSTHKTTLCLETQPHNQATLTLHSQQLDVCTKLDEQDRQLTHMLQHLTTAGFQRFTAGRQGTFFFKARPLHVKLLKQAQILTCILYTTQLYTRKNTKSNTFHTPQILTVRDGRCIRLLQFVIIHFNIIASNFS